MSDILEITELDFNDNNSSWGNTSSNFGGGLELLMNDRVKESNGPSSDINLDDFFEENNETKEIKNKIILEYTDEEFELVNEAFKKHLGSKEQIIYKLLGL